MRLGIDFGTTRTAVAVAHEGNVPVVTFQGPEGETLDWCPAVVVERAGELKYGIDALPHVNAPGWHTMRSFKRWLSDPGVSMHATCVLGGSMVRVFDLIVGYLSALRRDLQRRANLPCRLKKGEPLEVVIAAPAHAHSAQRFLTLEAFREAGFEVVGMMNEPSAAGVEFARRFANTLTSKREKVAIYDLGGGTFDASLVYMAGQAHDVRASAGLPRLGGDDLDEVLLELVLKQAQLTTKQLSLRSKGLLLDHCRQQKERLHPNSSRLNIELGLNLDQVDRTIAGIEADQLISVRTQDYYEACEPLLQRTLDTLDRALAEGAEDDALDEVAAVYVVGGASALPAVGRLLRKRFGRRVRRTAYPSSATAIGLALAHDAAPELRVQERLARHLGVFREAMDGSELSFDPILSPKTEVPKLREGEEVKVRRRYRPMHNIGHFRFVECSALDAQGAPDGDITPLFELRYPFDPALRAQPKLPADVPVERLKAPGDEVEEVYSVDAAGVLRLDIVQLQTGARRRFELGRPL